MGTRISCSPAPSTFAMSIRVQRHHFRIYKLPWQAPQNKYMADRHIFIEEFCFPFTTCSFSYSERHSKSRNNAVVTLDLHCKFTTLIRHFHTSLRKCGKSTPKIGSTSTNKLKIRSFAVSQSMLNKLCSMYQAIKRNIGLLTGNVVP
jgi:hypothetical protein